MSFSTTTSAPEPVARARGEITADEIREGEALGDASVGRDDAGHGEAEALRSMTGAANGLLGGGEGSPVSTGTVRAGEDRAGRVADQAGDRALAEIHGGDGRARRIQGEAAGGASGPAPAVDVGGGQEEGAGVAVRSCRTLSTVGRERPVRAASSATLTGPDASRKDSTQSRALP